MTDTDVSSYNDYKSQPNPLTQLGSIVSAQNQMNQNKLFQQTLQGRQAYGQALAENTDPNTGEINYPAVNEALAKAGPAAALSLPQASSDALARQTSQQQLTKAQVEAMQSKHALIAPQFADLASKPNPTMDDVYSMAGDMMAGTKTHPSPINIDDVQRELGTLPQGANSQQIKSWAMQQAIRSSRLANQDPSQFLPKPSAITTPTGTVMADTNPITNPGIVGSTVTNGLAPTTSVYNPATKQNQLLGPQPAPQIQPGSGALVAGGAPPQSSSLPSLPAGSPNSPPVQSGSSLPAPPSPDQVAAALPAAAQALGQSAQVPASALQQPGITSPGIPPASLGIQISGNAPLATGPALGAEAAENTAGTMTGSDLGKDRIAAKNSAATIYNMKQALTHLQAAPTGPGTESTNALKSFITAYDPTGLAQNSIMGKQVENYDEANKYLTAQAQNLASAVGPNTDANLSTALTGSPNTHINGLAAQDVQKTMIGLTRMNVARTMAFDQNPNANANDYTKFGAQWNKNVDPRAFMADIMPPKQLKTLLDDPKFADTYRQAVASGVINPADVINNIKSGQ
jgi:hypothetical protein